MKDQKNKLFFLPPLVESSISAGFPSPAEDEVEQSLDLNELMVKRPAATFFVRVKGDSMEGAGIYTGDILVVDRSLEARHDDIIVAVVGGEFMVKRLKTQSKQILLVAENRNYPPIKIQSEMDFLVWGVVTYVIHKTR